MLNKKWLMLLGVLMFVLFIQPAAGRAGGEDVESLREEIRALKSQIEALEPLKARLEDMEKRLAETEKTQETMKTQVDDASLLEKMQTVRDEMEEKGVKIGGALRFNYRYDDANDYSTANRDKGGDMSFDIFRFDVNAELNDLILSAQYRWYSYMDVIHHAWIGYNITDAWQGQLGITQVPFGILPYASHNWWFGLPYYVGLEDDYDMGLKSIHDFGDVNLQWAFFKNGEWGNAGKLDRYSFDVVQVGDQANEETNQGNLRLAYLFDHGDWGNTELGVSGEYGQLYNTLTGADGEHWAGALHLNGRYGRWNLMLEAIRYAYSPENPAGVNDKTIRMGAFGASFPVAAEADVYVAGLSYDLPINWGPISTLTFYNDYSLIDKKEDSFEDSQLNTLGCLISAGPVYTYIDLIMGKNAIWVGGVNDPMAQGDPNADWETMLNINFGYYF